MRLFIPGILGIIFIGWLFYRLIKKDIKNHLNDMYFGFFFIGIWVLIYWLMIR